MVLAGVVCALVIGIMTATMHRSAPKTIAKSIIIPRFMKIDLRLPMIIQLQNAATHPKQQPACFR